MQTESIIGGESPEKQGLGQNVTIDMGSAEVREEVGFAGRGRGGSKGQADGE